MESIGPYVCYTLRIDVAILTSSSYNRYLAVAARVVRRSLKEDKRLQAERRGEMDLRFAKWQVSPNALYHSHSNLESNGLMRAYI